MLEGLPSDFESLVNLFSVNNRFQSFSIDEIVALLLAQEALCNAPISQASSNYQNFANNFRRFIYSSLFTDKGSFFLFRKLFIITSPENFFILTPTKEQ